MLKNLLFSFALCPSLFAADFAPKSMAYVLQADGLASSRTGVVEALAGCGRDIIVLDAVFSTDDGEWKAAEIETIRRGKAGRRVVAYVSIGEAEDYRPYWQKSWDADGDGKPDTVAPKFLNLENPDWKGNYRVRYWQPEWQRIMLPAVDRVVAQGFDGIYLDIVDAFEFYEYDAEKKDWLDNRVNSETGRSYRQDMIAWVGAIAKRARDKRPGFMVIPQNAAQLLEHADYRAIISAVGVEDLFVDDKKLRSEKDSAFVIGFLEKLKPSGKPVLIIDYPKSRAVHEAARERAVRHGFTLLLTDRDLTTLGESK
jgi:cysteinyl-tRNA synthetase, unknown class